MEKRKLLKFCLAFLIVFVIGSCNKSDDKVENLTPDEAKVEVRSASQEITTNMDVVMNTPGMQAVDNLSTLFENGDWKSSLKQLLFQSDNPSLRKVKSHFRNDALGSNRDFNPGDYGVYEYNFTTGIFDLIEPSTTFLKLKFPASETSVTNNAELLADNLLYTTITYTETYWDEYSQTWITDTYEDVIPTNLDLTISIDGVIQITGNYAGAFSENGTPTSLTVSISMPPYSFSMGMSGSGTNYSTNLTFKQNDSEMMGYNISLTYSSDMSRVDKVTGYYHVSPLKIEGWINLYTIESHLSEAEENNGAYDLDFLNSQLSLALIQTELNANIGSLAFKMYTDPEYGETYPMIAVVYSDGTYEWLDNIMNDDSFKFSKPRK